jgi:predicted nucleic acid-binding protein
VETAVWADPREDGQTGMAYDGRAQKYLAIDSNVLVAYLDGDHPQHSKVERLGSRRVALNPTVTHETYHALVFKLKWSPEEARLSIREALDDRDNLFLNQTLETTRTGLALAERYSLGGRDSLILANYMSPSVSYMLTFDKALFSIGRVVFGRRELTIRSP